MSVTFEEENSISNLRRVQTSEDVSGSFLIKFLTKHRIAKDQSQANYILLALAVILIISSALIFSSNKVVDNTNGQETIKNAPFVLTK